MVMVMIMMMETRTSVVRGRTTILTAKCLVLREKRK